LRDRRTSGDRRKQSTSFVCDWTWTAALTYVGCRFNGACCRSAGNVINDAGGLLLLLLLLLMETGTLTTSVGGALDRSLVTVRELMMSTRSVPTIARFSTLRRAYRPRHLKT